MTISIWRYCHLTIALSSCVFLLVASITGVILAFQPITELIQPYSVGQAQEATLAETISVLQTEYDEVLLIEIDNNDFITASVVTKDWESETFYIDPFTGKKVGDIIETPWIFEFSTNVHRSLFLKKTGRFIVGFISFLLVLMAVSGLILIIKRQLGVKHFFSKIYKENFEQYYHVAIGRLTLIPLIVIAATGVYLSLEKFSLLPSHRVSHEIDYENLQTSPVLKVSEFAVFQNIKLEDVRSVEFPFSPDVEDCFTIELSNK